MKNNILAVAKENFTYGLREKAFIFPVVAYAIAFVLYYLNRRTFGEDMARTAFVSTFSFMSHILAIIPVAYLSLNSISKDISNKTIYLVLKSVSRRDYLFGKLLSLFAIGAVLNAIMYALFVGSYYVMFKEAVVEHAWIFLFQQMEFAIISVVSSLFVFFSKSNIIRIFLLVGFYAFGHMSWTVKSIIHSNQIEAGRLGRQVFDAIFALFPNLEAFNVRDVILYSGNVMDSFKFAIVYFPILFFFLFFVAVRSFSKKDL